MSGIFSNFAENYVKEKINIWQYKGKYEKLADWVTRVNEATRNAKIEELTREAERLFIAEQSATTSLACTLGAYDTETELFLIDDQRFGKLLIPVPITEAARFEQLWSRITSTPIYGIVNDKLALSTVDFTLPNGKKYRYNNQAALNHTIAQIDYNFAPIKIESTGSNPSQPTQTISQTKISVGRSDVDLNIPQTAQTNDRTFAVIVANENYTRLAHVPFALSDGRTFGEYCRKTLGLPASNVRSYENATYGTMLEAMRDIRQLAASFDGEIKVLFYYAGHGAPGEAEQEAYLIPVDAFSVQREICYPLDRLYKELAVLNARSVTVFLDACFSGATRDEKMLASSRVVAVKPRKEIPTGNLIVFSAASNDETALPYTEKGHGLFTYYLLRKLQESKGNATYGELRDYLAANVRQRSNLINRKTQTPSVVPSQAIATSWTTLRLR